jgi:hypothetical protein
VLFGGHLVLVQLSSVALQTGLERGLDAKLILVPREHFLRVPTVCSARAEAANVVCIGVLRLPGLQVPHRRRVGPVSRGNARNLSVRLETL